MWLSNAIAVSDHFRIGIKRMYSGVRPLKLTEYDVLAIKPARDDRGDELACFSSIHSRRQQGELTNWEPECLA